MPPTDDIDSPQPPSNKKFGWFMAAAIATISAVAYWKHAHMWAWSLFAIAGVFTAVTAVAPQLLTPVNRLWFRLGMLLGKIVSPVVLGMIFFLVITPVAVVTRLFGRDALSLKRRSIDTYWIQRMPPGPAPESFNDQF